MTEQIQKSISEVQDYFRNKIIKGEYTISKPEKLSVPILVDNIYPFQLWIYRECKNFELYETSTNVNFISFSFTAEEAAECYKVLEAKLEPLIQAELKEEKLQKYNNLKAELEEAGIID